MKSKFIISVILVCAVALSLCFRMNDSQDQASVDVEKLLKYSWSVRNTTNRTIHDAVLRIYSPVAETSNQVCTELTASHSFERFSDDDGNQILTFRIPAITPFSDEIIRVKAKLVMRERPVNESLGSDHDDYTAATKYIESGHPLLIEKAEELKGKNSRETAEKIHRWIVDNLHYSGYLKNERGALYALQKRTGDCTEYMDLFVALCRAVNIPARCVAGYVAEGDRVVGPSEYHNWAQFYDGRSWQIADPQRGNFLTDRSDYIAMRVYGKHGESSESFERFDISDSNLKVKMNH
ncbi:transglutaminase-like domain-containing protein [Desulfoluna spongiiphila]|uniref:transglutaminase-like domain-containing protein n=1 Tax=Desulfoluna spongiiphila TaxID=419481 RepID=UPI001259B3B3|nr:transglutaminase-like domain-containing protein [Desulfoluna spongiiphila]VVS94220.1 transglutaminase-like [Desulfoluna spongiiphila]